jgi:hypothetical protein
LPSYWGFALNSIRVEGSVQAPALSSISRAYGEYTGVGAVGSGPAPGSVGLCDKSVFSQIKIHLLVGNRVEVRSVSRATGFAPRWTVVASGRNLSLKNALALVLYYDLSFAGGLSTFPVHSDGSVALLGRSTTQLQSGGAILTD